MNALIHKFGLELDLTSNAVRNPDHKDRIEAGIRRKKGVTYAGFSRERPHIVVVEYKPAITTPEEIEKTARRLCEGIKGRIFL